MNGGPELVVNLECVIGEGPVWDPEARTVYWVDLLGNRIHAWSASGGDVSSMDIGQNAGCIALRKRGGLVAALQHGFYLVDFRGRSMERIGDPEDDKPGNRFNDGKCDCRGRFWAGTMSKALDSGYGDSGPAGSVYRLDPDMAITRKIQGVTISNGMGWSPDDRVFYYIDSPTRTVVAYDYDPETGGISDKRVAVRLPEGFVGMPDGMCVDAEGMLWIALWGGSGLSRWDPSSGRLLERLAVPALNVSCCAFGGDGLDELYITTARTGTDTEAFPLAGGLFTARPGVKGLPAYKFGG
jgi:sugar lactone lactonase YvrE